MNSYSEEVGARLRQVRSIFNEGGKLSADQFAFLLGESRDKIANYELGRAGLPVRVLYELYKRGINPIYIIAGEGSVFADNIEGENFKEKVKEKIKFGMKLSPQSNEMLSVAINENIPDEGENIIKLAAGRIPARK